MVVIPMLELYKRRVRANGKSMGEKLRNQSNDIMNATFTNDAAYKECLINGEKVDAKFQEHASYSILKDYVDHYLQFSPHVFYPNGTYVDIPDESNVYQRWLIVGRTESHVFVRHLCVSCNYTIKWIINDKIDFIVHGHWHKWGVETYLGRPMISNGSLPGADDLSKQMAMEEGPRQAWFLVKKDQPLYGFSFVEW